MAAVSDKDYSSYQDIREESGHYHLVKFEELTGLANGSNTVYYAKNTFIVDRNYNDVIDVACRSRRRRYRLRKRRSGYEVSVRKRRDRSGYSSRPLRLTELPYSVLTLNPLYPTLRSISTVKRL
jgi:hypothetical protein